MFPEADTICYIFVGTSLPQFANIPSQWQLPSNPISPELDFVSWFCLNHQCWLYMNVSLPVFGYPFCFTYLESVTALLVNRVSNLTPTVACCCFILLLCSFVDVMSLLSTLSVLNTGLGQLFRVLTMCLWKLQADVLTCSVSTVHWAKRICVLCQKQSRNSSENSQLCNCQVHARPCARHWCRHIPTHLKSQWINGFGLEETGLGFCVLDVDPDALQMTVLSYLSSESTQTFIRACPLLPPPLPHLVM